MNEQSVLDTELFEPYAESLASTKNQQAPWRLTQLSTSTLGTLQPRRYPSSPPPKTQSQLRQPQREMISRFHQQGTAVLTRREAHIELINNLARNGPNLHQRQILADAVVGTGREGRIGIFLFDQFWFGGPALGDEGERIDEVVWGCEWVSD